MEKDTIANLFVKMNVFHINLSDYHSIERAQQVEKLL